MWLWVRSKSCTKDDDDIVPSNRSLPFTFFKLKILFKCTIRIVTPFLRKNDICHMRGVRKYNPSSNVWLTSPFLMGLKVAQTRLVSPDKGMVQHQRRIGSIRITSFEKKFSFFVPFIFNLQYIYALISFIY